MEQDARVGAPRGPLVRHEGECHYWMNWQETYKSYWRERNLVLWWQIQTGVAYLLAVGIALAWRLNA
jgi:hypothetical protein